MNRISSFVSANWRLLVVIGAWTIVVLAVLIAALQSGGTAAVT